QMTEVRESGFVPNGVKSSISDCFKTDEVRTRAMDLENETGAGICPPLFHKEETGEQPTNRLPMSHGGLRCSQPRNGYAERAATHVIQAGHVAEFDAVRVAAVLAADAHVHLPP